MQEHKLKYTGLDTLRGFAAVAVALYHFLVLGPHVYLLKSGHLAVDFFFCLSGFVIAYAYEDRLRAGLSVGQFFVIRLIRFYPLYLLGFLFGLIQFFLERAHLHGGNLHQPPLSAILTGIGLNFLLLPGPGITADSLHESFSINFPAWSLFCELVMNLFYALILRFLTTPILIGVITLFGTAMSIAIFHSGSGMGYTHETLLGGFLRCGCSFFMGALLFRLRDTLKIPGPSRWLLALCLALPFFYQAPQQYRPMVDIATIVLFFPAIVWLAARPERQDSGTNPIFRLLGATSYGLYAIHVPLIWIAIILVPRLGAATMSSRIAVPIGLLLITAIVLFVGFLDTYYDRPLRRSLLQRFTPAKTQRPSVITGEFQPTATPLERSRQRIS